MWLDILYILIGFVLLVKGGDFLIDGAVAIAQRAKLSAMVIGITVVGFGTSMPELLVSTQAAWVGSSGLAIGNVAGSNIANVALILGVTALICPLPSQRKMMRIDLPFMLFAMLLFIGFSCEGFAQDDETRDGGRSEALHAPVACHPLRAGVAGGDGVGR